MLFRPRKHPHVFWAACLSLVGPGGQVALDLKWFALGYLENGSYMIYDLYIYIHFFLKYRYIEYLGNSALGEDSAK